MPWVVERARPRSGRPKVRNRGMTDKAQRAKTSLFLVDDHALVRRHLAALLEEQPDLQVCGEAADAPMAFELIARCEPDLVLLDLSLQTSDGLSLLTDLLVNRPALLVLVVSMHEETVYAERAFRAGARGYLTKADAAAGALVPAVRAVLADRFYLSPGFEGRLNAGEAATLSEAASTISPKADPFTHGADRHRSQTQS